MKKKLEGLLKNLAAGLVGALWIQIASLDLAARTSLMIFGLVTVSLSLANLATLGEWRQKRG